MTILKGSEKIVASLNQFGVVRRVRQGALRDCRAHRTE